MLRVPTRKLLETSSTRPSIPGFRVESPNTSTYLLGTYVPTYLPTRYLCTYLPTYVGTYYLDNNCFILFNSSCNHVSLFSSNGGLHRYNFNRNKLVKICLTRSIIPYIFRFTQCRLFSRVAYIFFLIFQKVHVPTYSNSTYLSLLSMHWFVMFN